MMDRKDTRMLMLYPFRAEDLVKRFGWMGGVKNSLRALALLPIHQYSFYTQGGYAGA